MHPARVRVEDQRGVTVAHIEGEIDMANVAEVLAQLIATVSSAAKGMVVDLTGTRYLDSQGVYMLLNLADRLQAHQQELRVVVPAGSVVRRVLVACHLDERVPLDAAIGESAERILDRA